MIVSVCGRAGSGKTTLANSLKEDLAKEGIASVCYSGDLRFRFDSRTRRQWLIDKWNAGLHEYLNAVNQFNWWNFDLIRSDLNKLASGHAVTVTDGYDRKTGNKNLQVKFPSMHNGVVLYENCILGDIEFLQQLNLIFLVNTPDKTCLERTITRDVERRSLTDILCRFLITCYSENIFFKMLLNQFRNKTVICNSDGMLTEEMNIEEITQIPVPIPQPQHQETKKGTVFIDLDGTLVKHVPVPSEKGEDIELLEGSVEKLQKWKKQGYLIVLCTARQFNKTFGILNRLERLGIVFDQVICDLPVGPRYLINDSKNDETRAFAVPLKRDSGVRFVNLP